MKTILFILCSLFIATGSLAFETPPEPRRLGIEVGDSVAVFAPTHAVVRYSFIEKGKAIIITRCGDTFHLFRACAVKTPAMRERFWMPYHHEEWKQ
jgi:hypothetical protein